MAETVQEYRKKPVVIEACRLGQAAWKAACEPYGEDVTAHDRHFFDASYDAALGGEAEGDGARAVLDCWDEFESVEPQLILNALAPHIERLRAALSEHPETGEREESLEQALVDIDASLESIDGDDGADDWQAVVADCRKLIRRVLGGVLDGHHEE